MLMSLLVACGALLVSFSEAQLDAPNETFSHSAWMSQGEDEFLLLWNPSDDEVVFELQVSTKGYVGLGFSPNGGMGGADIIIAYVKDGITYMQDRYATGKELPAIDPSQDYNLIGGYENDTHTVIRFSRLWDTCDLQHDFILTTDTIRVIWAIGSEDPASEEFPYYHSRRGTRSILLKEMTKAVEQPTGSKYWDIKSPNISLPGDVDTIYWCKMFKILQENTKHQMIGYVPLIQKGNEANIHHMVLYQCNMPSNSEVFEHTAGKKGAQCYSANMPDSWQFCTTPIVAWAIGGIGELFPSNVGYPLGEEHGGSTYFLLEIHYDNPNYRKGVVDSSGLRVFYTDEMRPNDMSVLVAGQLESPLQIIPPDTNSVISAGHCSSECTKEILPPEGIRVISGLLHAHLLARKMKLRLIRNGVEIETPLNDYSYDFNFQQSRNLEGKEMRILPGDHLITECYYNSSGTNYPTFGGIGTSDEMCAAYLLYYPRVNISRCVSTAAPSAILKALGRNGKKERNFLEFLAKSFMGSNGELDVEKEKEHGENMDLGRTDKSLKRDHFYNIFYMMKMKGSINDLPESSTNFADFLFNPKTWEHRKEKFAEVVNTGEYQPVCINLSNSHVIRLPESVRYPKFRPLPPPVENCTTTPAA